MLIVGKFKEVGIVPGGIEHLPKEVCDGVEEMISKVESVESLLGILYMLEGMNIHFVGSLNRVFPSGHLAEMISCGYASMQCNLLTRTLGLRQKFIELHEEGFFK